MKHLRDRRQRLNSKLIESKEPYLCADLYSLALYVSHSVLCLDAALITDQSGGRRWYTQLISGSLAGNHVRIRETALETSEVGWSHPQSATMWRFAAPFTTKCFFVQFQWSCNSVISRRIARTSGNLFHQMYRWANQSRWMFGFVNLGFWICSWK